MRRKLCAIVLSAFAGMSLSVANGQSQSGYVRTVSRPDQAAQRISGVVIRVQGEYNPVMTDEQGAFQVLMPGQKNGSGYTLAGVNKGGYELREPEIVGRQLPFSSSVPLEIIMVSRRQLQRDKQRIEQAARENIERYYEEQLNSLNEQLTAARMSNEEYAQQLSLLEAQYDRYEPLIEQMADRYARTDYASLSQNDSVIQQAIERGDLQTAQQQILAKGDPVSREKKMLRVRRQAEAQRDELANDYYNLYNIYLSRFQNDSALHYILRRAQLDTTNAQWQTDAGNFYDKINREYDKALALYRRALRYALANEGSQSLRVAQAHNNIAYALSQLGRYEEALPEQRQALEMYSGIYGNAHTLTAARMSNLGSIYYYLGRLDSAQSWFSRAEEVYTAIENDPEYQSAQTSLRHAHLLHNQAAISISQKDYETADRQLRKALELLPREGREQDRIHYLRALGVVCYHRNHQAEARANWQEAYELAIRIYGAEDPLTKQLAEYLQ